MLFSFADKKRGTSPKQREQGNTKSIAYINLNTVYEHKLFVRTQWTYVATNQFNNAS